MEDVANVQLHELKSPTSILKLWLGLSKQVVNGTQHWYWDDTKRKADFSLFAPGQYVSILEKSIFGKILNIG